MSDDEYEKKTQNGKYVHWYESQYLALKILDPKSKIDNISDAATVEVRDESKWIKVDVSRQELIQWLEHEQGSMVELFPIGKPEEILNTIVHRANQELSAAYPWTSFAIQIHGNPTGVVFPTAERWNYGPLTTEINRVHARKNSIIACGSNSEARKEIGAFIPLFLWFTENCELRFTPAQVVEGKTLERYH